MRYLLEVTRPLRANDIHIISDSLVTLQFDVLSDTPLLNDGNGYRIIEYDEGVGNPLRINSTAILSVTDNLGNNTRTEPSH